MDIGQVELKNDKDGNVGLSLGKKSFSDDKILKNFNAVIETLDKEKSNNPIKGDLIRNIFITSTMGISYKLKLNFNFFFYFIRAQIHHLKGLQT